MSVESVEEFRQRARAFLKENMPRATRDPGSFARGILSDEEELADVQRNRDLQRLLFDGGLAGICFPKAYGGQGLTTAHAAAFNEEIVGYQYPDRIQVPTFAPCASVLLEFGSEEQKLAHIPAILKGEEIWMQFLSEPSGGSDVAGAQTTAVRDGDEWVLNGSKIWTTGAWWSDWGLCLARTNWDVPKHRGLSVFMLKIHQPGIEVHRIEMLNGSKEFCQEFISDVRIPDGDRIGQVDDGWTVGIRWMFYEKSFALSSLTIRPSGDNAGGGGSNALLDLARAGGRLDDPLARDQIGEAHALTLATRALAGRITKAMATGKISDQAAGLTRVMGGMLQTRLATIEFELAGSAGVAWAPDDQQSAGYGMGFLVRQASCIGGGTTEMSRNVVSERVLGMPRERTLDRDVPFRDVPKGPTAK
ncbi:MAG TPA: acyl-CoA dehydrogenase family protein [Acidimicrobiales bacterium]|nr:acyl-CoA dehydrogenase family protein [Acidimicrobiales bacterium]